VDSVISTDVNIFLGCWFYSIMKIHITTPPWPGLVFVFLVSVYIFLIGVTLSGLAYDVMLLLVFGYLLTKFSSWCCEL